MIASIITFIVIGATLWWITVMVRKVDLYMEVEPPLELVILEVEMLNETEMAYLVTRDSKINAEWIPKSQVELIETGNMGVYQVTMPEWMAKSKGFI